MSHRLSQYKARGRIARAARQVSSSFGALSQVMTDAPPTQSTQRSQYRRMGFYRQPRTNRVDTKFVSVVYPITFTFDSTPVTSGAGAALSFKLSDIAPTQLSAFQELYDQYMIHRVELRILPLNTVSPPPQVSTTESVLSADYVNTWSNSSALSSALDFDSAETPGSQAIVLEYQNHKVTMVTREHKRVLYPRFDVTVSQASPTGTLPRRGYLSTSNADTPHYGAVFWLDCPVNMLGNPIVSTESSVAVVLKCYARFCLKFRNQK